MNAHHLPGRHELGQNFLTDQRTIRTRPGGTMTVTELPTVHECTVAGCSYNQDTACHAGAIKDRKSVV